MPVTCHTFRDCSATHLLENGDHIRTEQGLMGHSDVATTTKAPARPKKG